MRGPWIVPPLQHQHDNMAERRDLENASTPDERAPLLAPQRSDGGVATPPEEEPAVRPQSETSKRREYGWRGFWIVTVILVIALFVKGWIESDDVDVSIAKPV